MNETGRYKSFVSYHVLWHLKIKYITTLDYLYYQNYEYVEWYLHSLDEYKASACLQTLRGNSFPSQ
jgi:hypothetical protein